MSGVYAKHLPRDPESRWIRVLDTSLGPQGTICGNLRHVSLDNHPSYDALSYTWGNPSPPFPIVCGKEKLWVTANCFDALLQLCRGFKNLAIWVDVVCIDQSNEQEKSHQVSLMKDIFDGARKVYVWLGKGNERSDYAMDWLADASHGTSVVDGIKFAAFPENMMPRELLKLARNLPLLAREAINRLKPRRETLRYKPDAMHDLIRREWFKRMWTVQEVVMANEPILVCGSRSIFWSQFFSGIESARNFAENKSSDDFINVLDSALVVQALWVHLRIKNQFSEAPIRRWLLGNDQMGHFAARRRLLEFLHSHGVTLKRVQVHLIVLCILLRLLWGYSLLILYSLLFLIISCIATVIFTPSQGQNDWKSGLQAILMGVLNKARKRQATKQVDKIFGLYGLLKEFEIPLQKPDYGKSVGEVYFEFTCTMIEWYNSLKVLSEASGPSLPDTPSWVPDWSRPYHRICRVEARAAKDSIPNFSISTCDWRLTTSGAIAERVTFCTDTLQEPRDTFLRPGSTSIDEASISRCLHNVRVLVQWTTHAIRGNSRSKSDSISDAPFEVFHSDMNFTEGDRERLHTIFTQWYSIITADYSFCSSICTSEQACALALSTSPTINEYHLERCRAIAGTRIFFTTSQGLIGTGPQIMQVGDRVALLSGFDLPMVLREVGHHYRVIGPACVHGMMRGELWPGDVTKIVQLTII